MAMSQTLGKIVFGRIADHPGVNRVYLYQLCLLVCSVLTTLLPVFTTYRSLLAYCLVFGFHDGCFVVLIAVLTGDIVGRKMMGTAYGVMFFFTGIPMMLGPPVASEYLSWNLVQSTATNPFTLLINSPHCLPYNSYDVSSENLVLDQPSLFSLLLFPYVPVKNQKLPRIFCFLSVFER